MSLEHKLPQAPSGMSPEKRNHWRRVVGKLLLIGKVTPADRDVISTYCDLLVDQQRLNALLKKEGTMIEGSQGQQVLHPAKRALNDVIRLMLLHQKELGLTPAAREGKAAEVVEEKPKKGLKRFTGNGPRKAV